MGPRLPPLPSTPWGTEGKGGRRQDGCKPHGQVQALGKIAGLTLWSTGHKLPEDERTMASQATSHSPDCGDANKRGLGALSSTRVPRGRCMKRPSIMCLVRVLDYGHHVHSDCKHKLATTAQKRISRRVLRTITASHGPILPPTWGPLEGSIFLGRSRKPNSARHEEVLILRLGRFGVPGPKDGITGTVLAMWTAPKLPRVPRHWQTEPR